MPFRGLITHETVEAWQGRADADLNYLRSLTSAQLGAEVMRRGFADLPADGERTQIGLSNSLCPVAPRAVGDNDFDVVAQYSGLLVSVLSTLEAAGLISGVPRGRSGLRFYRVTTRGRSAIEDNGVATSLAAHS